MGNCSKCGGGGGCSGCGSIELNPGEVEILVRLGQLPFLPVGGESYNAMPVLLGEENMTPRESGLVLLCLEKKGLVSLERNQPLKGYAGYGGYPVRGSVALTEKGQRVLELLEIQGAE